MKKIFKGLLLTVFLFLSIFTAAACSNQNSNLNSDGTKTITDMAGREVTIPGEVDTIYSMSPIGTILVYTLDDELVAGLNYQLSDAEKAFTTAHYQSLPVLGGWYGQGQTGNIEEIIKADPDVILSVGDITASYITQANDISKQLNKPVVMIDGGMSKYKEAYTLLGEIANQQDRAKKLGEYCDRVVSEIKETASQIPMDKRVTIYYAEGTTGLQTDPIGSQHTEVIDLVGAVNVANVPLKSGYGRSDVSMEQVISWNPEVIIAGADAGFSANSLPSILKDAAWKNIKAVQNNRVYQIPYMPTGWLDRPPSVMRVLGAMWLGNLLYPSYHEYDIKKEIKEFYKLFLHMELTDSDLDKILKNAK